MLLPKIWLSRQSLLCIIKIFICLHWCGARRTEQNASYVNRNSWLVVGEFRMRLISAEIGVIGSGAGTLKWIRCNESGAQWPVLGGKLLATSTDVDHKLDIICNNITWHKNNNNNGVESSYKKIPHLNRHTNKTCRIHASEHNTHNTEEANQSQLNSSSNRVNAYA